MKFPYNSVDRESTQLLQQYKSVLTQIGSILSFKGKDLLLAGDTYFRNDVNNIWVDEAGDDNWSGTFRQPKKTIQAALDLAYSSTSSKIINVMPGRYKGSFELKDDTNINFLSDAVIENDGNLPIFWSENNIKVEILGRASFQTNYTSSTWNGKPLCSIHLTNSSEVSISCYKMGSLYTENIENVFITEVSLLTGRVIVKNVQRFFIDSKLVQWTRLGNQVLFDTESSTVYINFNNCNVFVNSSSSMLNPILINANYSIVYLSFENIQVSLNSYPLIKCFSCNVYILGQTIISNSGLVSKRKISFTQTHFSIKLNFFEGGIFVKNYFNLNNNDLPPSLFPSTLRSDLEINSFLGSMMFLVENEADIHQRLVNLSIRNTNMYQLPNSNFVSDGDLPLINMINFQEALDPEKAKVEIFINNSQLIHEGDGSISVPPSDQDFLVYMQGVIANANIPTEFQGDWTLLPIQNPYQTRVPLPTPDPIT